MRTEKSCSFEAVSSLRFKRFRDAVFTVSVFIGFWFDKAKKIKYLGNSDDERDDNVTKQ